MFGDDAAHVGHGRGRLTGSQRGVPSRERVRGGGLEWSEDGGFAPLAPFQPGAEVLVPARRLGQSVLAAGSEVLTGRAGGVQLRLNHLENERSQGLVSEADYARQRDEILGGSGTTGP